eukprot:gnl/MRDRNA2_/MRDRNA2_24372_c0_seq1.p1 gnl/MRDRNA2_/MRDRNA2_24372_c0~~gnl/MRDRNA2_/MRDRNA2_24372_c0_seq1.p1  ORF type:complete len:427 (+),score=60.79 gnl/MRDRNA2_/MRDRNA2_24372_c0_seq1:50-1330(+)
MPGVMPGTNVILLLHFFGQAHLLFDKKMVKLVKRARNTWPPQHAMLDSTTIAKPGKVASWPAQCWNSIMFSGPSSLLRPLQSQGQGIPDLLSPYQRRQTDSNAVGKAGAMGGIVLKAHASASADPQETETSQPPKVAQIISSHRLKNLRCVFSDVDGTLTFGGKVSDRTLDSIQRAMQNGLMFFPATGRPRAGMDRGTQGAISRIFNGLDKTPGVYMQGLMVYGPDGKLIWQTFLSEDVVEKVVKFCDLNQATPLAYCGDDIYTKQLSPWTDVVQAVGEVEAIKEFPDGLDKLHLSGMKTYKMVIVASDAWLAKIRSSLETEMEGIASVTQALPGILEVLPLGCSKGDGVVKLLEHIGVSPEECAAFGDGENDLEMFQVVEYGIAVANAKPMLKEAAQFVTESNSENGVGNALDTIVKAWLSHSIA